MSNKVTTKFVARGGKHTYLEIPKEKLKQFNDIRNKYKFLILDGKKYEFAGSEGPFPVFQEIQPIEVKIAQTLKKLPSIEEFIKVIGIKEPLKGQIETLKDKKPLYPKDKAKLKTLWYTAKRDSLQDMIQRHNVKGGSERDYLNKVLSFLNDKITESLKEHSNFPEPRDK